MDMSSHERRRANRVVVNWVARVGRKGLGVAGARVRDIAIGGAFIETPQRIAQAAHVLLEIAAVHDGKARKLLVEGEVVRVVEPAGESGWGYGIRFLRLRDDDLFFLLAVVAELWAAGAAAE
jgi:hypothetical protein